MTEKMKRCSVCKKLLPISEFYIRRDRMKPISRCKNCNRLVSKKSWAKLSLEQRQERYRMKAKWFKEQAKKGNLKAILQHKINSYRGNAGLKGVPFEINVAYLIKLLEKQKGHCYYTGEKLEVATGGGRGWRRQLSEHSSHISLDRLEPRRGYVPGNLVWCTLQVNTCKNLLTEQEFYNLCKAILRNKSQKWQDGIFGKDGKH